MPAVVAAATPGAVSPIDAGLSAERLERVDAFMQARIDQGDVGGAVLGIARHGRTGFLKAFGRHTDQRPLDVGTVFDLSSLTKPVTAVAALQLQERGVWLLDDSINRFLPAFGSASTVRLFDLARQASGLPTAIAPPPYRLSPSNAASSVAARPLRQSAQAAIAYTGDDFLQALAKEPARTAPGLDAVDDFSFDVLGLAIEAATSQTLGEYFLRELFIPLDMWDTAFNPGRDMRSRFAPPESAPPENEAGSSNAAVRPQALGRDLQKPVSFECGGACLTGTVPDYLRFAAMLLGDGHHQGQQVLAAPSVQLMTTHQLNAGSLSPGDTRHARRQATTGYGLGLTVQNSAGAAQMDGSLPGSLPGSARAFGMAAPVGSFFWVDPADGLTIVLLMTATTGKKPQSRDVPAWPAWRLQGAVRALAIHASLARPTP